jgi:hypothetical protein
VDRKLGKYEVMYTPQIQPKERKIEWVTTPLGQPVVGKKADMVIMDDVETPSFGETDAAKAVTMSQLLNQQMMSHSAVLGMLAPKLMKEKDMIGGDTCHLCGATLYYESGDKFHKKNDKKVITQIREYKCGSTYSKTYWYKHDGEKDIKTTFVVGKDCIQMGGR